LPEVVSLEVTGRSNRLAGSSESCGNGRRDHDMENWRKRTSDCGDVTVKLLVPNTNTDDLNSTRTWLREAKEPAQRMLMRYSAVIL